MYSFLIVGRNLMFYTNLFFLPFYVPGKKLACPGAKKVLFYANSSREAVDPLLV